MFRRELRVRAVIFHWALWPASSERKSGTRRARGVYGTPEMRSIFFTPGRKRIRRVQPLRYPFQNSLSLSLPRPIVRS